MIWVWVEFRRDGVRYLYPFRTFRKAVRFYFDNGFRGGLWVDGAHYGGSGPGRRPLADLIWSDPISPVPAGVTAETAWRQPR